MKRFFTIIVLLIVCLFPTMGNAENLLATADSYWENEPYNLKKFKQAVVLYAKAVKAAPDSYEANWKYSRALRDYGYEARMVQLKGWEDICTEYGKKAMNHAEKAIQLEPGKVEGHFFYALSIGIYADSVGIFTIISEGLKNKSQEALESAYKIDKWYESGGPVMGLGRFWASLPWPMHDKKEALALYRELQHSKYFTVWDEGSLYLAELLIDRGGNKNDAEAEKLLKRIIKKEKNNIFSNKALKIEANDLLDEID